MRKRWIWTLIVMLVSGMCMCPNLDSESFARLRPDENELIGRYTLTAETLM